MQEFVSFLHTNYVNFKLWLRKIILSALDTTSERLEVVVARSDKFLVVYMMISPICRTHGEASSCC